MSTFSDTAADVSTTTGAWRIRFVLRRAGPWGGATRGRWRWTGHADLCVGGSEIEIDGRRARPFWWPARQKVRVPFASIRNVAANGRVVQLELTLHPNSPDIWVLRTDNPESAQKLVALLPTTRTVEFERVQREAQDFGKALQQVGARVVVTPTLVGLNVAAYLWTASHGGGWLTAQPQLLLAWGTNFGPATIHGEWWRLLSAMFIHFGLLHLLFNMWALAALGPGIERLFGSGYFALLYLLAGLGGSLVSITWHPAINSAGASGAIFGLLGGLLAFMLNPATRIPASIGSRQRASALVFIGYNLLNGLAHRGIDNGAHIGGLLFGFVIGWLLSRPLDPAEREEGAPKALIATAVGAALLLTLAWPLMHRPPLADSELAFREDLLRVGAEESQALTAWQRLARLRQQGALNEQAWGQRVDAEVVPHWQAILDTLSDDDLPPGSSLQPLRGALIRYAQGRQLSSSLAAEAARTQDASKQTWANEVLGNHAGDARQVAALIAGLE